MLHLSFVMGASINFSLTRINHVHHHCHSEGTKSDIVRFLDDAIEEQDDDSVDVVGVRLTSHLVRAEACSRRNFLRITCPLCVPIMCNINWVKETELTMRGQINCNTVN